MNRLDPQSLRVEGRPVIVSRMSVRDLIIDAVIIGPSAALLWHFSNIWRYGQHLVGEPNIVIRSLETAGLVVVLAFGVSKFIRDLKGGRR